MKNNLVMLTIMDGYGLNKCKDGNAVFAAKKPNLDYLFKEYPNTTLGASGEDVGLPDGQMGNSEVGHLNIGAGRVVYQSLTQINISVRNNELINRPAVKKAIDNAINNNGKVHIMGLLSDGGVHSHINHILYLLENIAKSGVKEVVVHAFLDGRDVPPKSAKEYLTLLNNKINEVGHSKIGMVSGRYYVMDRDNNWDRVQPAYDALVYNKGIVKGLFEGIDESYSNDVVDEFVYPYLVNLDSNINDGDSVIFANFRKDRAIEISTAITNLSATPIKDGKDFKNLTYVCMMLYSNSVKGDLIFPQQKLDNIFGDYISSLGLKQLRIAETEKFAHVTFFFDGGLEKDYPGEKKILIPSPKVATYDLKPQMSAYEVCDQVVEAIKSENYDTIVLNLANCDMVGHTGIFEAAVKAVEVVDECIGKIYNEVNKVNGTMVIIADHGNADKMIDENGKPFTAHTSNTVPCIVTKKGLSLRKGGNLGDVVPTMLQLMNLPQPKEMTGKTLIR